MTIQYHVNNFEVKMVPYNCRRDSQDLAEMEEEQEIANELISVTTSEKLLYRRVTLRTVDNFLGEEVTIVIDSLVRYLSNSGILKK
ncbi:13398_t:CDS:2 [Funneliformis geosporum]|uniref:230_t:CDS:1 n=1 Tax=Funneliformis geosporum TaxID=1117311 RepID=A0A9W4WQR1_9GLOM|nr:230_t:CDS:2 [Funneliformis geosporum]CAI2182176.1 13398_t:CDS:2 [Funneliformis geosporum]